MLERRSFSIGTLMGRAASKTEKWYTSAWDGTLPFLRESLPCSFLHYLSFKILLYVIVNITYSNTFVKG